MFAHIRARGESLEPLRHKAFGGVCYPVSVFAVGDRDGEGHGASSAYARLTWLRQRWSSGIWLLMIECQLRHKFKRTAARRGICQLQAAATMTI